MEITNFTFASNPALRFGEGTIALLPGMAAEYGNTLLLVTGRSSFKHSRQYADLQAGCRDRGLSLYELTVAGEPTPELVDQAADEFRGKGISLVAAVGGGSVIDAGKAVSCMLAEEGPVMDLLEGVGTRQPSGKKVPFVAAPTTAGTGSEATKNAVLSRIGRSGFKRSLRHDRFVPDAAVLDPELALSCPPDITAATGMDAVTQLLEAYVSVKANVLTDALAASGLKVAGQYLVKAFRDPCDLAARTAMAYAAYLSGLCLANAGLGVVHGLASPIGALHDVPHGVVCGTLLGPAVRQTLRHLREGNVPRREIAIAKYAVAGRLLSRIEEHNPFVACDFLTETIDSWTEEFDIPRLGKFGILASDVSFLAEQADNKNNPVVLSKVIMQDIIKERL